MAEKIKKRFFRVLPSSIVVFMVLALVGVSWFVQPVDQAEAAQGDMLSMEIRDTDADGYCDTLRLYIDNTNTTTWTAGTSGSSLQSWQDTGLDGLTGDGNDYLYMGRTVSGISFFSATNANPIVIDVALVESEWGQNTDLNGWTHLEYIYSPVGLTNGGIEDGVNELNAVAVYDSGASDTELDKAAPIIRALSYSDQKSFTSNGKVDGVWVELTEGVAAGSVLRPADLNVTNVGDFTGLVVGADTTNYFGSPGTSGAYMEFGTESSVIDGFDDSGNFAVSTQGSFSLVDSDSNVNNTLGAQSQATIGDFVKPWLLSFTSTTPDNTYGPTSAINLTATYSENLGTPSTVNVTLDNGATATLNSVAGATVTGTYTVGATGSGEDSTDLTVAGMSAESIRDIYTYNPNVTANIQSSSSVPAPPNNIADTSAIVIDTTAPTVSSFSPVNGSIGVAATTDVVVTFSEAMNTGSLTYTLAPNPGGLSVVWSGGNTIATISHTAFNAATSYTFTVTAANDVTGNGATGTLATTFTTVGGILGGGEVTPQTTIAVGSPNGGETLTGGSTRNITWSSTGDTISKVKLFYSTDSGVNFLNTIAIDEENDGTYSWTVPNISSDTVKIKIGGYDSSGNPLVYDISDADFAINYTVPDTSAELSTLAASPTSVVADGAAQSTITVTVKDSADAPMSGKTVTLSSSRDAQDVITTVTGTTGTDGKTTFKVSSSTVGTSTFTAAVNGTVINQTASVVFTSPETPELPEGETPVVLSVGDLIKSSLSATVYYYGSDNKRHIFPNEATYKTWYLDWSGVKIVPATQLQGISLGHNVTIRPGTLLVKIETDPKVYAVEPGGILRWVPTEERAMTLYGAEWAKRVVDVPLVSWTDYTFGTDITTDTHPTGCLIKYTGMSDIYYIQGTQKRLIVSTAAFDANHFRTINILAVPTTFYYVAGTDISGAEPSLVQIY